MADARVSVPPDTGDAAGLARLLAALDAGRDGARYIGGWVRDRLLGLAPQDLDIATRLPPRDALARAEAAGLNVWSSASGIAHGTIGVVLAARTIEVTTLRTDVSTDGRHAEVAFTDDWRADAARRDFTINALSADPADGRVHDYFGGLGDLAAARVRFIGDPLVRIAEDHLRILRFFRFHARFGGPEPDAPSLEACVARARDLMALSRERIAGELLKLLAVRDPVPTVRLMLDGGVLAAVLPEAADAARLAAVVAAEAAAGLPVDGVRRLAALLPRDPATMAGVAARLRLSNADRRRLALAAEAAPAGDIRALAYRHGVVAAVDRVLLAGEPAAAASVACWAPPRLPLTGGALIARGLAPGPIVARTLARIEADWIARGFPADLDAIVDNALDEAGRAD